MKNPSMDVVGIKITTYNYVGRFRFTCISGSGSHMYIQYREMIKPQDASVTIPIPDGYQRTYQEY
jgi:hypothetical protein